MNWREIKRSVQLLFFIYVTTLLQREKFLITHPIPDHTINPALQDTQGWDGYWETQKSAGGMLYDTVAAFYRKFIIKRSLNSFIRRYFPSGAHILHAGCGSGQVDTDISQHISITGLDISVNALRFYLRTNKNRCNILHGSIFDIPLPDHSVDGIYNLGVMEHFSEVDIQKILHEFRRILKPNGRIILFWPPEFGLSVLFLKCVKFFLPKNIKLHPDEITRVKSRKHVTHIVESAGFHLLRYYFGPKDLFTYSVIVVEPTLC